MHADGQTPYLRRHRFARLAPLLLLAVPVAVLLASASNAGRAWFAAMTHRTEARPLLRDMTVEAALTDPRGLVVTSIRSDSEAERLGITVGDRILALDGHTVASTDDARSYLRKDSADTVDLWVFHGQHTHSVRLHASGG